MKTKLRIVSILCLIALTINVVPAHARYSYISTLSAGLEIGTNEIASCAGKVTLSQSGYKCTISVTLKKLSGSTWGTHGGPWTGSGSGYAGASASGSKKVDPGTYKTVAVAKVYDANDNLLETGTVESPSKSFS